MIKPEQIPDEVVEALLESLYREKTKPEAIAAAINAWPGMEERPTFTPSRIILPIHTETDDE